MKENAKEKFSRFCAGGVLALMLGFMAVLAVLSLLGTYSVTTGGGEGEVLSYGKDNVLLNLLLTAVFLTLLFFASRLFEKVSAKKVTVVLLTWTAILSSAFVCSAKLQPSQDAYIINFFATQAAKGDYSYYHEYFRFFPYQLGFALYEEIFYRLFFFLLPSAPEGFAGLAMQLLNVLYTAVIFFTLVKISGQIFKSERVEKITALLLFFCFQPMLFATFIYGNTPSLCFAVLSVWMYLRFAENEGTGYAVLCIVFICLAALLKLNTLICVVAIGIVWLISIIKKPSFRSAALLALMIASVLLLKPLPQKYYEAKMGEELGKGIPQSGWLAMGLHEGQSGPGWYDPTYTATNFITSDYDPKISGAEAKKAISERLSEFAAVPGDALRFFGKKLGSQWNEPSYESLWLNQVNKSYSSSGKLYELICKDHAETVFAFMNIFQQAVFIAFTAGLLRLLKKREINAVLLPLVILGAFLYHLLFEAKSQYALGYFLLMIPTAAYGIDCIGGKAELWASPLGKLSPQRLMRSLPRRVPYTPQETAEIKRKTSSALRAPSPKGNALSAVWKERSGKT